jgi:hypothetical protein
MAKEKQSWERQKGESAKAYYRFKVFLELPPEQRSIEATLEKINSQDNSANGEKTKPISKNSLEQMSSKWAWFERAALYDSNQVLKEMEENDKEFKKTNKDFIKVFKESLKFADELLQQLIANVNDNALSTRINMFNNLMNVLDTLYRNYRLACGRSTQIRETSVDANVDANVETLIGEENIHELTEEDLELILSANDNAEDFTDNL